MYYYSYPLNVATYRRQINPLNGRSNITFKSVINRLEQGVDTISSIIPLYKKVEPVFKQGKNIFTNINSFFKPKQDNLKEKVEVEIVDINSNKQDYRYNNSYSKPYFK